MSLNSHSLKALNELTPLSIDAYAAPMVPLSVYKNGPLFWPSLGPETFGGSFEDNGRSDLKREYDARRG